MGSWTSKPSRPNPFWAKGCVSKRPLTEKQALKEVERISKEKNLTTLRTYHCPNCGKWHLTSSPKRDP